MIVERRAYQVDSGQEKEFWAVQRDWHWPKEIGDYFNHLIGYFETVGPGPREIVHLYRFENLADWEARYRALYQRFPPHLFTVVRKLLSRQDNVFMAPAPLDLPCVPDLDRPSGPAAGYEDLYGKPAPADLIVQEIVTDFLPGGIFNHWDAINQGARPSTAMRKNLIGTFNATTGRLHRMYEYRWFSSRAEAAAHQLDLARDEAAAAVSAKSELFRVSQAVTYLKPAQWPWLRPLFEPLDWKVFEARDPAARRIAEY